ncbi:hypothetical protein [Streptomyces sp. NPDC058872]|uniref:hypothetical protein n=1 Tax=Streptomyces sp. NPDC058872 TaxID=3346661 RepID=UPI0036BE6A0D
MIPETDAVTAQYLRECQSSDGGLRTAMRETALPPALSASSGQRLLHRPLFLEEREVRAFADDVIQVYELLTSLPTRLFDGDIARYCAALGFDERRARLNTRLGGGKPPLYGRADMYHDGTGFKLLEFNLASELGGVDRAGEIPRLLLGVEAFGRFAEQHALRYVDTGRMVAETLRTVGTAITGGREPVVAVLEAPGGLAGGYGASWRAFEELMRGFGLDLHLGEIGDVRAKGDQVLLGGRKLDVVLRCYSADEILAQPDGESLVEPVCRAHEAGTLAIWTPMESNLANNKACLAMLSDPRVHDSFDAAELAVIDRVLPWTRAIGGTFGQRFEAELSEECVARREELILKPNAGYGGSGVLAGWTVGEDAWREALASVDEGGAIVQERVRPRSEPVIDPQTGTLEEWQAAWGLFVTPQGYAGTYARALPAGESAVIGIGAHPKTRTAGVFTYQN